MKLSTRAFRLLPLLAAGLLGAVAAPAIQAGDDLRFFATLTPAQRELAGLNQLTADNVAVIHGLVRQDLAASRFKHNPVDDTRFSQRRTARERAIAGLDRLTPAHLAELDILVGQRIWGTAPAREAAIGSSSGPAVASPTAGRKLDLHGEISFIYGWGQGGSVTGGDIVLAYDDPASRYSLLGGYSEYRGKGLLPCYYPGCDPYRPLPGAISISR